MKKQRKLPKLTLQKETLRSLAGGFERNRPVNSDIIYTVYSTDVGCRPVTDTCRTACQVCWA
ncbi:MAG TPA: hypothetical protein VEL74_17330 [Thermoanaerobaculia bacterium]|nr:hypothetical protein [Thermoanaerobaculia bacterium]